LQKEKVLFNIFKQRQKQRGDSKTLGRVTQDQAFLSRMAMNLVFVKKTTSAFGTNVM